MEKQDFIKGMLEENIRLAEVELQNALNNINDLDKLPDDCTNLDIDGEICENKNYKFDIINTYSHYSGYMEGIKFLSEQLLVIHDMNQDAFDAFIVSEMEESNDSLPEENENQ